MAADTSGSAATGPLHESAGDSQAIIPMSQDVAIEEEAAPGTGSLRRPPAPAPRSAATARRGNPGSQVREWKIDVQPSRPSRAFCPRCNEAFVRGTIRIGSAAKGGKSHLHIPCVDATLPAPTAFRGWDNLSLYHQGIAREQLKAHSQARGGVATEHAPKRVRHSQPVRLKQLQLAFATTPMPREAELADAAREPAAAAAAPPGTVASGQGLAGADVALPLTRARRGFRP